MDYIIKDLFSVLLLHFTYISFAFIDIYSIYIFTNILLIIYY